MTSRDFVGNELRVGDQVIIVARTGYGSKLQKAEVLRLTPKCAEVKRLPAYANIKDKYLVNLEKVILNREI